MLAIRFQRIGKAHFAMYRISVQDSHKHPMSGNVVAYLGSYNPHTKEATVDSETAQKFLDNGAQPSPRVASILKSNGVKLPKWVEEFSGDKKKSVRNAEKLRKNQPKEEEVVAEEVAPAEAETPAAE
jgi:small subunit ribosomal protein S16